MTCDAPHLHERIEQALFGDVTPEERSALEAHLLVCDACWNEFERINAAVLVLRSERSAIQPVMAADLLQLAGLGGRLGTWFGGHSGFVWTIAAAYGAMSALAVLVEVAYEWNLHAAWAPVAALAVGTGSLLTGLVAFEALRRFVQQERRLPFLAGAVPLALWTALAAWLVAPWLPEHPVVLATFQTMPARVGWTKSLLQALEVPMLSLVLFHGVLMLQRELQGNRVEGLLKVLIRDPMRVNPKGFVFIPPAAAAVVYVLLAAWWIAGTAHLLDNLQRAPYMGLFMALAQTRMAMFLAATLTALIWYALALNGLKREAIAIRSGRATLDNE